MNKALSDQAIEALKRCDSYDQEMAHVEADEVLCKLLTALGYSDVVDHYRSIDKWYA